jgi:hypothetical protein
LGVQSPVTPLNRDPSAGVLSPSKLVSF